MFRIPEFDEFVEDPLDDGLLCLVAFDERDALVLNSLPLPRIERVERLAVVKEVTVTLASLVDTANIDCSILVMVSFIEHNLRCRY